MILLDSDVMIDLLRQYPAAISWFDTLNDDETLLLPGYVVMELIQGCELQVEEPVFERGRLVGRDGRWTEVGGRRAEVGGQEKIMGCLN